MKMKNKSPKQKISQVESDKVNEQSFSKITFRKRSRNNSLEVWPDIEEEKGVDRSEKLDFISEKLNQSSISSSNDENYEHKKKRKKKKNVSEQILNNIYNDQEGFKELNRSDNKSIIESEVLPELNSNCPVKKKKKKRSDLESSLLNLSKDDMTDKKEVKEDAENPRVEFLPQQDDEVISSMVSTDYCNVPKKKKKKKYHSEDSLKKLNLSKERINVVKIDKAEDEELSRGNSLNNSSTSSSHLMESCLIKNKEYETMSKVNEINIEDFSEFNKTLLISPNKHRKRKHSQLGHDFLDLKLTVDSPLLKNKKKAKMIMDESNLNNSSNEQFPRSKMDLEENEVDFYNITQAIHSAKKKKHKTKKGSGFPCYISVERNDEVNEIKNLNNKLTSKKCLVNDKKSDPLEAKPSSCTHNPPKGNFKIIEKLEIKNQSEKEVNNVKSKVLSSKKIGKVKKNKVKSTINDLPSPKKRKELNNDLESLRHQLLKEALVGTKLSEDMPVKPTKLKKRSREKTKNLRNEEYSDTKVFSDLPTKSSKPVTKFDQSKNIKKHLTKEAYCDTKANEGQFQGVTKLKTGESENVETLRKRLFQEAISSKRADDFPLKSQKLKDGVKENVDILRQGLLKKAFQSMKGSEGLSQKANNSKTGELNPILKPKSKNKNKTKHKKRGNDIDLLTDILISKALEKVSSSSASHSSQENINSSNIEVKSKHIKKHRKKENKIVHVKSEYSERKPTKVQDESRPKFELEKIKKALLSNAMKNINSGHQTSKSKLNKKSCKTRKNVCEVEKR